jgi:sugar-specific transcriptional regulator TrmB
MDANTKLPTVAENVIENLSKVADNIESVDSKEVSELVSGASKSLKRTIDEKVVDGGIVPSSTTIDLPLPQTEEEKRKYEMMRDNDLMELFLGGRRRLMVLIEEEIPERT